MKGNTKTLGWWKQLDHRTRATDSWKQRHTVGIGARDDSQQGWAWVALGEDVGHGRVELGDDM